MPHMSADPVDNMSVPLMYLWRCWTHCGVVTLQVGEAGAVLVVYTRRGPLDHELPVWRPAVAGTHPRLPCCHLAGPRHPRVQGGAVLWRLPARSPRHLLHCSQHRGARIGGGTATAGTWLHLHTHLKGSFIKVHTKVRACTSPQWTCWV